MTYLYSCLLCNLIDDFIMTYSLSDTLLDESVLNKRSLLLINVVDEIAIALLM